MGSYRSNHFDFGPRVLYSAAVTQSITLYATCGAAVQKLENRGDLIPLDGPEIRRDCI